MNKGLEGMSTAVMQLERAKSLDKIASYKDRLKVAEGGKDKALQRKLKGYIKLWELYNKQVIDAINK